MYMRVKKFTILAAAIDGGTVQTVNAPLNLDRPTIQDPASTKTYAPVEVQFTNSTGAVIGYVIVTSDSEQSEFDTGGSSFPYFDYVSVKNTEAVSEKSKHVKQINIKKLSGVAASNLDLYLVGYNE